MLPLLHTCCFYYEVYANQTCVTDSTLWTLQNGPSGYHYRQSQPYCTKTYQTINTMNMFFVNVTKTFC